MLRPDEDTLARSDRESALEWDAELGVDGFVTRERALRGGPWPRRALRPWSWVEGPDVLASCELYEVAHPAGRAWLLASVFTPRALRGRGHASAMLRAVEAWARTHPDAVAIFLFSDVGTAIYERLGYRALPAIDLVWDPIAADPDAGPWRRFSEAELAASVASAWPPLLQLDWQVDRSRTRAEVTRSPRPSRCGAIADGAWMVWTDEDDELVVLAASAPSEALVEAARRTAAAAGLARVRAWQTDPALPGGRREPRTDQIPMVLPLRDGLEPELFGAVPRGSWV